MITLDARCEQLRDHVIQQLINSWVARVSPEQRKIVSEKVGLSEDLLRDLHVEWSMQRIAESGSVYTNAGRGKTRNTYRYHFLDFQTQTDYEYLRDLVVNKCQVEFPIYVMSLLHHYLLQTEWEPALYKKWLVQGRSFPTTVRLGDSQKWRFKVYLSLAAMQALSIRATNLSMPRASLVRSILCTVLNSDQKGFGAQGTFRFISKRQLFSDVSRYKMPESTVESEQDEAE